MLLHLHSKPALQKVTYVVLLHSFTFCIALMEARMLWFAQITYRMYVINIYVCVRLVTAPYVCVWLSTAPCRCNMHTNVI